MKIDPFPKADRKPAFADGRLSFEDAFSGGRKREITFAEIAYLEAFGDYTLVHLLATQEASQARRHIGIQCRFSEAVSALEGNGFHRVNTTTLANLSHVQQRDRWLCRVDGQWLTVSPLYSDALTAAIRNK